jgi:hypothetical protein
MAVYRNEFHEHLVVAGGVEAQGIRVVWGGVWSGFLVGAGVFLLLSILGLAIGVSTAEIGTGEQLNASGLGMGAAIWSGLALLISLFVGGMVATRTGVVFDRATGVIEGVLVWVLSILAILYMASSGIGFLASSVSGLVGGLTQSAGAVASGIDVGALTSGDANQIVARLEDPKTTQLVAAATGMSPDEARSTLNGIAQRVQAVRNDPAQALAEAKKGLQDLATRAGQRVERAAAAAQPYASATMWTTLVAMLLALVAAVGGALTGRNQVERRLRRRG